MNNSAQVVATYEDDAPDYAWNQRVTLQAKGPDRRYALLLQVPLGQNITLEGHAHGEHQNRRVQLHHPTVWPKAHPQDKQKKRSRRALSCVKN